MERTGGEWTGGDGRGMEWNGMANWISVYDRLPKKGKYWIRIDELIKKKASQ